MQFWLKLSSGREKTLFAELAARCFAAFKENNIHSDRDKRKHMVGM